MKRFCLVLIAFFSFCRIGYSGDLLDLFPEKPGLLTCWSEIRSAPRPLRVYYLKAMLNSGELEVIALPGEDPDGPGPAESTLTRPEELFRKFRVLAAVNANAFAGLPGDNAGSDWFEGRSVDIYGMVVSSKKIISPTETNRTPFWLDGHQKPHIGVPDPADGVTEAVSDWFSPLLINSRIVPSATDSALHPRTALGFDDSGTWLLFAVVDGRQPGFSEGVTLYELAEMFQSMGCSQAVNLDGGGSSILLAQDPDGVRTINRPSGKTPRPVPVMLGVRKRKGKQ
jgi:exopolysaccharide biosynthesis protein